MGPRDYTDPHPGYLLNDELLARQLSTELNHQSISGHALPMGTFPNQQQNPSDGSMWRFGFSSFSWGLGWKITLIKIICKSYSLYTRKK